MDKEHDENKKFLEQMKDKYFYVPESSPEDCIKTNYFLFKIRYSEYDIVQKLRDILIRNIPFFDNIVKFKVTNGKIGYVEDEMDDIELKKLVGIDNYKNNGKYIAKFDYNTDKKDAPKMVLKEFCEMHEETDNILKEANENSEYYCKVVDELLNDYKKHYWENGVGKIYDKTTKEIIALLNNNYNNYEQRFIYFLKRLDKINLILKDYL
jgi:hypothetical protein